MGAGLKKDLRVSRVGPGGSLNAFFFLLIGVLSQRLTMARLFSTANYYRRMSSPRDYQSVASVVESRAS